MLKKISFGVALLAGLVVGSAWADESLFDAVISGDKAKVEALIVKGADINARDKNNNDVTPLNLAAAAGHLEIVKVLFTHGADINTKTIQGLTPLHLASQNGHKDTVGWLISRGVDVNAKDNGGFSTPLNLAAINGRKDVVAILLAHGAEANPSGTFKPLLDAVYFGHKDVAEMLISHGADTKRKNDEGETLLHSAGSKDVAELLIAHGADVNAKNKKGETPLHNAAGSSYKYDKGDARKGIAEVLLAHGADVNAKDNEGETPLYKALYAGSNSKVVGVLLAHGADVNAINNRGETPLKKALDRDGSRWTDENVTANNQVTIDMMKAAQAKNIMKQAGISHGGIQQLLGQFKGHSEDEILRKSIIDLALKLKPQPAIPQEAEDAAGRAAYIFNNAKSDNDTLNAAKEYLVAIEVAPWVANYYYNLCTVLEKTPYTQQALHACKLYLEAGPNAEDSSAMRQRIAGLKYAVGKNRDQKGQRTTYTMHSKRDDIETFYYFGGISGKVFGKDVGLKLSVNWQAAPPKYQVLAVCIQNNSVWSQTQELVTTDRWISLCDQSMHLVIKPDGMGFVELGVGRGSSLRATIEELFTLKRKALEETPIYEDIYHKGKFYVTHYQSEKEDKGYAIYATDCNGNFLRQDPRALPDYFVFNKEKSVEFLFLHDEKVSLDQSFGSCSSEFLRKTGYKFGENE